MEGLTAANMEAFVGSMPGILMALRWLKRLTDYAGQKSFNIARPPWHDSEEVESVTLERVGWFSNCRLVEPIGNIPPAVFEMAYYRQWGSQLVQPDSNPKVSGETGSIHIRNDHNFTESDSKKT